MSSESADSDRWWVLQNARECAGNVAARSQAGFARLVGVHRSNVSRWELGRVELTCDLVRRYELALGLRPHQLLLAIDYVGHLTPPYPVASGPRPPVPDDPAGEAEPLLERALSSTDRMDAWQWERLTHLLSAMPNVLLRAGDWEELCERIMLEHSLSRRLRYALISEAAARFASHPRINPVIADRLDRALGDPLRPMYGDVADFALFGGSPLMVDVLLRHLRNPAGEDVLWSCLIVLTSLDQRGFVDTERRNIAVAIAVRIVRDSSLGYRVRRIAATFIASASGLDRTRAAAALMNTLPRPAREDLSVVLEGSPLSVRQRRTLVQRARDAVRSAGYPVDHPTFTRILGIALTEPNEDLRGSALAVLMLIPQGDAVGRAVAGVMIEQRFTDPVMWHETLSMLAWIAPQEALDPLIAVMLDPKSTPEEGYQAAVGVGNTDQPDGPSRVAREDRILSYGRARISQQAAGVARGPGNVRGVCYVLGMQGRFDAIKSLDQAARHSGVQEWSTATNWWLYIPERSRPRGVPDIDPPGA